MIRTKVAVGWMWLLGLSLLQQQLLRAADPVADVVPEARLREAITPALKLIEHSSAVYLRERECFSCHHQAMSIMTLMMAREYSFQIDQENLTAQVARSIEHLQRGEEQYRLGKGQGGGVDTAGYALLGLAAAEYPPNKTTDAVVAYLLQIHAESRHWKCSSNRPPTEANDITTSALALRGLAEFARSADVGVQSDAVAGATDAKEKAASDVKDVAQRVAQRRSDCQQWLSSKEPVDTEERVFRLYAAQTLDEPEVVKTMQQSLIQSQQSDGGWAQTSEMTSDAYATGTALVALASSGCAATELNYQRGLQYLLADQKPDGSWLVATRSKPIQKYFESGFPHGVDQFLSISATCWSSMALMHALPQESANAVSTLNQLPPLPWQKTDANAALTASVSHKKTPSTPEQIEFFEREIRPVLIENCVGCHGSEKQSGSLRVDQLESLLAGGDTGPALVPGSPDRSLLIKAIKRNDELKMPPEDPLTARKIELLEQWIAMGAPWPEPSKTSSIDKRHEASKKHWAFQPIRSHVPPEVGESERTQLSAKTWAKLSVDRFIQAGLEQKQLVPNEPADRAIWLRRLFYDLTGLPPTAEEIADFVADDRSDAFERQVDRLLASPRFGEQWGRKWLDIARYSDSKGYVYAREERFYVNAPSYRDWVVDALNSDMPYDRFVLLQLAADQAAPHDVDSQAAMGFLTVGRRFLGVTHDIIDDRIDVVTRGLLGLTVGCARCHDHKFDPIPTDDYYSLYGVFLNTTEERVQLSGGTKAGLADSEAMATFNKELAARQKKLRDQLATEREAARRRVMDRLADYLIAQCEMEKVPAEGFDIVIERTDLVPAQVRRIHAYLLDARERNDPIFIAWRMFESLPTEEFAQAAGDVVAQLQKSSLEASNKTAPITINPHVARRFVTVPVSLREVAERYGQLLNDLDNIECTSDYEAEALRELRALHTADSSPFIVPDEQIVSTEQYFESSVCTALWKLQAEVDSLILQSPEAPPFATVLVDRKTIREPFVFRRGNPLLISHRVPRHFLSAISFAKPSSGSVAQLESIDAPQPPAFKHGSGRLELAQAIIDPHNPLTSRVWVNRLWQHLFAQGLVSTPSDFGLRATQPSHPELLDHLVGRLLESSGSTKQILRDLVLSQTYRQASKPMQDAATAERARELDPDNRLLWHAPVKRLSFEQQRDTWLMVADALDNARGGQARTMFDDEDNVRRSVYGQVDRQFLPGVLRVFDFANPDLHTPVRSETIVPQQALFELNHAFVARSARRVVESVLRGAPEAMQVGGPGKVFETSARPIITALFEQVLGRGPTATEVESALAFLDQPTDALPKRRVEADSWQYGFGKFDEQQCSIEGFTKLPHFNGQAWQGGVKWPDDKLGWVQVTATGGHAGNDLEHAAVRRWTAPTDGEYQVQSVVKHNSSQGDGIRVAMLVRRSAGALTADNTAPAHVILQTAIVHDTQVDFSTKPLEKPLQLRAGDNIDFVVDFNKNLNNDQFAWAPQINRIDSDAQASAVPRTWNAEADFAGAQIELLDVWQQLAQVLLVSNELMFIE